MMRRVLAALLASLIAWAPTSSQAVLKSTGTGTASQIAAAQSGEDSLTAFAGGGQTNATALSATVTNHRVTVVATAADSVKLPAATVGQAHYVRNDGVASMQVFGQATETIDGVASATGVPQAAGTGTWYVSTTAAKWTRTANYNPANVSITGGTITGTNVPYIWAKWGAPIVFGPTGTMANNCAITWGTALPNAYTGGAWIILPAGAVAAGVPAAAAILWYVGATTTTGTCFNSTMNLASPGTAGTATAFATTGPGAFTGVTAQTTIFSSSLPASSLGLNGELKATLLWTLTNNANAKSDNFTIGATDFFAARTLASNSTTRQYLDVTVGPTATKQFGTLTELAGAGATGSIAYVYGAEDFSTALTVAIKATRGTATDIMVLEAAKIVVAN